MLCIYLLKQNRIIVPDKLHDYYPGKIIYRRDPKFLDRSSGQTVPIQIISLCLMNPSDLGLHSCHSVFTLLQNRNNRPIIVGQGLAVLAAGTGWKMFDILGHF